jgi:hypothetical protein
MRRPSALHWRALDGEDLRGDDGVPVFIEVGSPTDDELNALLRILIKRLMTLLVHRGVRREAMGRIDLVEPDAVEAKPARGGAGRRVRPQAAGSAAPLHHAPGAVGRAGRIRRCRQGGVEARDVMARRHHAPGDVAAGVHAAVRAQTTGEPGARGSCKRLLRGGRSRWPTARSGSGSTRRLESEESFAGRHASGHARVPGEKGAAVIRPADPPRTGFGLGRRSAAKTDRQHPV